MTTFEVIRLVERILGAGPGEILSDLPESAWDELWGDLRKRADRSNRFLAYGDEPRETPKRHGRAGPARRSPRTRIDRAHDALLRVPLTVAFERITGQPVPRSGMVRCPVPGHEDRHPSCRVGDELWHCFGCGAGGSIYDLGSEVYGIATSREAFVELRRRLALDLLGREEIAA